MSLKQILLDHLNKTEGYVTKGQLGLIAEQEGYLPESVGRHLRHMAEHNEILADYYKGKRNQKLVRYARLGEEVKPIKTNIPTYIENPDGTRSVVFN